MSDFISKLLEDAHAASESEIGDMLLPVGGDNIIGTLDAQEIGAYTAVANIEIELSAMQDSLIKRSIEQSLNSVQRSASLADLSITGMVGAISQNKFFINDSEASDFFRRISLYESQNSVFWHNVRSRLPNFTNRLDVRSGWRVVSLGKRYK